jgi:GT2 family glycosyltransferase
MIYIVIPVFNRWHFTEACLESLASQTYRDFKVVVVDHGSTDGTRENLKKCFPDVIVLYGDESMWWTAATNLAVEYALRAGADYVLTLNNDTKAEPDYLGNLFLASQQQPKSLIGSLGINADTKRPIYGGELVKWYADSSVHLLSKVDPSSRDIKEVSYCPGRGLLIPKDVFYKIGFFDTRNFPHYLADYDFTLRAKKAGYGIFCAYGARLGIFEEQSGANTLLREKSWANFKQHLFGMKGAGNIPLFYKYAFRHCPFHALPFLLVIGTCKRIAGYWSN